MTPTAARRDPWAPRRQPYYVFAPDYRETSSGVVALHLLCHALNLAGEEAWLVRCTGTNPRFRTPILPEPFAARHKAEGLVPIAVYPEVVSGNPLEAAVVARYILNKPGLLGGDATYDPAELLFTFAPEFLPPGMQADRLKAPLYDLALFRPGFPPAERQGRYFYANRHRQRGGAFLEVTADCEELSLENPRSFAELGELFRRAEILYSYERSALCIEAMICGCPVVYLPGEHFAEFPDESELGRDGAAWGDSAEEVARARATVGNVFDRVQAMQAAYWSELDHFVARTQAATAGRPAKRPLTLRVNRAGAAPTSNAARTPPVVEVPRPVVETPKPVVDVAKPVVATPPPLVEVAPAAVEIPRPVVEMARPAGRARPLRVALFSADHPDQACFQVRMSRPFAALGAAAELRAAVKWDGPPTIDTTGIDDADVVILQRHFPRAAFGPMLTALRRAGMPVIYETDDLLHDVPATNPNAAALAALAPHILDAIRNADAVIASTGPLARELSRFNPRVHVVPNQLDESLWGGPLPQRPEDGPIVIGYAGTTTHVADLALVERALLELARKWGDRIAFRFLGCATPRLEALPGFKFVAFDPSYEAYARALPGAGIDIGVVPLVENAFNRCKSDIKWLEYSACGIAGVYSDLPAYAAVEHERTGLRVPNTRAAWFAALDRLVSDAAFRQSLAEAARAQVLARRTLRVHAGAHLAILESVIESRKCRPPPPSPTSATAR